MAETKSGESKSSKTSGYAVYTQTVDPNVEVDGESVVVSNRTLTLDATSEADAKKKVEADLDDNETVVSVTPLA